MCSVQDARLEARSSYDSQLPKPTSHFVDLELQSPYRTPCDSSKSSTRTKEEPTCADTSVQVPREPSRTQVWLQVLVGHLVLFNSFGLIQSFGIFQSSYQKYLNETPFTISWIGSTHIFLVYFVGTFSGRFLDAGHYREYLGLGMLLQIAGFFIATSSDLYPVTFVAHGVIQGIGHGLMFCPAVANTALYFEIDKNKMLAMAVVGSGAATGGMVFPGIARATLDTLGWVWTLRIMGFVVLGSSIFICMAAREHPHIRTRRQEEHADTKNRIKKAFSALVDREALRDPVYLLYVLAMFFVFTALWIPYFYVSRSLPSSQVETSASNARQVRNFTSTALGMPPAESITLVLIMNACGIPGRILPAVLADRRLGTINSYILTLLGTSLTIFLWTLVTTKTGMYVWAVAYGYFAGGTANFLQAGIASLNDGIGKSNGKGKLGVRIGMAFSAVAFAGLIGGPVGGELIEAGKERGQTGKFLYMQIFTGLLMLVGCSILTAVRVLRTGWIFKSKV
jgi:MFS family permease